MPPKKKTVGKSFRLLDFQVYDHKPLDLASSSSSDSDNDKSISMVKDTTAFIIQMYGINETGETVSIFVHDYQPFFFVKCHDHWTQKHADQLRTELARRLDKRQQHMLVRAQLVEYNKLYGFTGGKPSKFVQLVFQNSATMMCVRNYWYYNEKRSDGISTSVRKLRNLVSQECALELYESKLPPLLRYFHIYNISPSGWVFVPTTKCTVPYVPWTTCKYEYICSSHHLVSLPNKETRVPYKICSFDIEASSSHGDFPIPVKTYKRLASNLVDVYTQQMSTKPKDRAAATSYSHDLLRKIIRAGFGYGKMTDVDLVYPKGDVPTLEQVDARIERWFLCGSSGAGSTSAASSIESMFEKMKEHVVGRGGDDDDAAADADDDGVEPLAVVDDDDDDDDDDIAKAPIQKSANATRVSAAAAKQTILDVLDDDTLSRDDRIQHVNDAFATAGFPPLEGDQVTFIGSTFMRYGESEPYMNHCVVLDTCDPVLGAVIETTTTEADLLRRWTRLIQQENPDIIIGYNIFGFDYEFMFRRSQETGCEESFLQLSRKMREVAAVKDRKTGAYNLDNTQIVLATGEYDLRYPRMSGRLQIDMYTYFRRDFNLASYKLDDVAGNFIRDDVKRVVCVTTPEGEARTELYTNNIAGLHVQDYIHLEISSFTSDYYRDGHKFVVVDIRRALPTDEGINVVVIAGHETDLLSQEKTIKWCMAKDDVTPQDIFALTRGSSADRARVAKYCIQDCNLVHHLLHKIDVITGYIEMSRICSVPISFLVFRGQGIKLTSYVSKKCREKRTLMPDLEKSYDADGYEGAIVLPPKCSMYMDNPVACLDYASLYPSSMISNNLSPDSKVWTQEYDLEGNVLPHKTWGQRDPKTGAFVYDNLPGHQYIDIEYDLYEWRRNPANPKAKAEKTKVGKKLCRWAQLPDNQKSILPAILEELLKARSDTRKMIKTEPDPFMQNILDKRQLGYKVTANSLYGQCGAKTSTFYEKDVAASTTATGRSMITYAKRIIEEVYGNLDYTTECHGPVLTQAEYVYGDSVASYTPVTLRLDQKNIMAVAIEHIPQLMNNMYLDTDHRWVPCRAEGKQDKEVCELADRWVESWTEQGWTRIHRIIRHALAPHKKMVRIVTPHGIVDVTDDHSLLTADAQPISPNEVTSDTRLLHRPVEGICMNTEPKHLTKVFSLRHDDWASIAQIMGARILYKYNHEQETIRFCDAATVTASEHVETYPVPDYEGYVYDLTTENHHFAAGIGGLIVHNTDSVFFTFNLQDPVTRQPIRGKRALEITIEIAQDAAHLCSHYLKHPMELTYEKTLMPFILLSKKRYVGMLYETNPNKGKMKYMGLSLKRRDSCDYLKDTYGGILTILMEENNVQKAVEFLDRSLQDLIAGNVPMDKLTITKALRGHYKNPRQIAHCVLAERIGKRDPGNKPKPGDRMKFVHVVNSNTKALQGDKIETPEYIVQQRVPIDYAFYITNQLMKPLQQLFGLALDAICTLQKKKPLMATIRREVAALEREWGDNIEVFMKKREKYCSNHVKALLFDRYLVQIQHQKTGVQSITAFFGKRTTP